MKRIHVLLLVWQVGCAATSDASTSLGCGWTPDPELYGAHLDTDDCNLAACRDPALKEKMRKTIEVSADYWGVPYNILWGWKIRLVEGDAVPGRSGHTDWLHVTIIVSVGHEYGGGAWGYNDNQIETSSFLHEVGHVALPGGDPMHWDEKWYDDEAFLDALQQLVPCAFRVPPEMREGWPDPQMREDGCIPAQYYDHWWDGY